MWSFSGKSTASRKRLTYDRKKLELDLECLLLITPRKRKEKKPTDSGGEPCREEGKK
jgi:hypothetical protein